MRYWIRNDFADWEAFEREELRTLNTMGVEYLPKQKKNIPAISPDKSRNEKESAMGIMEQIVELLTRIAVALEKGGSVPAPVTEEKPAKADKAKAEKPAKEKAEKTPAITIEMVKEKAKAVMTDPKLGREALQPIVERNLGAGKRISEVDPSDTKLLTTLCNELDAALNAPAVSTDDLL